MGARMSRRPMTTDEMRAAADGAYHEYRPSFKRLACSRCGRDRQHPTHGPKLPALNCPCGETVERHHVGDHLRLKHGIFACGLDPWKMTDRSLAELMAFIDSMKARAPSRPPEEKPT